MKLMIIDDEYYFRQALKQMIPWEKLDLELCCECENGEEGLENAIALEPDIILADINMPRMNGLDFIAALKDKHINTSVVIISGYNDFSYAKKAITLGVQGYILKPIDEKELVDELKKVCKKIEHEEQKNDEYRRNMDEVKNLSIDKLIHGEYTILNNIIEDLKKTGCSITNCSKWCVTVAEIENNTSISNVMQVFLKINDEMPNFELYKDKDYRTVIIHEAISLPFWLSKLEDVQNIVFQEYAQKVKFGIGMIKTSANNIKQSYEEAVKAVKVKSKDGIIAYKDLDTSEYEPFLVNSEIRNRLILLLKERRYEKVKELINNIFDDAQTKNISIESMWMGGIQLLLPCIHLIEENGLMFTSRFKGEYLYTMDHIQRIDSWDDMKEYILRIYENCCDVEVISNVPPVVSKALSMIEEKYSSPELSVDLIAKTVAMNYNYLCVLFKRNIGKTINDYIRDFRMQKAMEILSENSLNVGELSELVGYTNQGYFTKCFKKHFGVPPSRYLKNI